MTRTLDMDGLEKALENRAEELTRSLNDRDHITIEPAADKFDARVMASGRETAVRALVENSRLLRQVEAARERLRSGNFGTCLRCGEYISAEIGESRQQWAKAA